MMKNVLVLAMIAILLAGCGGTTTAAPTVAPTAVPATVTAVPAPTTAASPTTAAAAPTLEIKPGSPYELNESGFSFTSVEGVIVQLQPPQAMLSTIDQQVFFSLAGEPLKQEKDAFKLFADFVGSIQKSIPDLDASEPIQITIAGVEGLSSDLSGTMAGTPFRGQAVLAVIDGQRVFYASGIGMAAAGDYWQAQGQPAFRAVLDTVTFFEPKAGGSLCVVTTDETYGTTMENPIKVGGDWTQGPYRERAYMDVLRGPNGEAITYKRVRSEQVGDVVLDVYEISGLDEQVTLYLDMYSFDTLEIPAGFTCAKSIPLGAP